MENYTEIHNLVTAYQCGNSEAAVELLKLFDNLIQYVLQKYRKEIPPIAYQDMYNHAVLTFLRLTSAYNHTKGIDFPYYIKKYFEYTFTDTLGEL